MTDTPTTQPAGDAAAPREDHPRAAAYADQRRHVRIETRVLEKLGVRAALSVPGVISHSSGIGKLTGRRLPRIDVRMDGQGRSATVDAQIAVAWPGPVVAVAQVARETVAEWIERSTGVPVLAVNVEVAAVVPVGDPAADRVRLQDLREAPRTPLLSPVQATPLAVTSPEGPAVSAADRTSHPHRPAAVRVTHPHAGRPQEPVSVDTPPAPVVAHVPTPASPVISHVPTPPEVSATHVPVPPPPSVRDVRVTGHPPVTRPTPPRAPELQPVHVDHSPVVAPPQPAPPTLTTVTTPPHPPLRNVPTPRGLPVENIPTPDGLPVTVFPQVERRGTVPVTVRRHPRITVRVRKEKGQ